MFIPYYHLSLCSLIFSLIGVSPRFSHTFSLVNSIKENKLDYRQIRSYGTWQRKNGMSFPKLCTTVNKKYVQKNLFRQMACHLILTCHTGMPQKNPVLYPKGVSKVLKFKILFLGKKGGSYYKKSLYGYIISICSGEPDYIYS